MPDPSTAMEGELQVLFKAAMGGIYVIYDFTLSSNPISQFSLPEHFLLLPENTTYRAEQILDLTQLLSGCTKVKGHLSHTLRNRKDSS